MNPAVTLSLACNGLFPWRSVAPYMLVQFGAAFCGVALAHCMFDLPLFAWSDHVRSGPGQALSEAVATSGLLLVVGLGHHKGSATVATLVAPYIAAAYWFTASTSFANPAVAIARSMTNTFSGIRPDDLPGFIAAEIFGALIALVFMGWLLRGGGETILKEAQP